MKDNKKAWLFAAALLVIAAGAVFIYYIEPLTALVEGVTAWLVQTIEKLGYAGIVTLMFIESSFIPFPSEVVLPPAGYSAWKGEMSFTLVVLSGITGSILGALFNYWLAFRLRPFLTKYGKYFFISEESLQKTDVFFARHGHVSTLVGRLLPVIRQLISLPAGLARMKMSTFLTYTTIGAGTWTVLLTAVGYMLGEHQELVKDYFHLLTLGCIALAVALAVGYLLFAAKQKNKAQS